jgi:exopolyphosphatase/guanosine-5'-triphosphate,3'-diphosphate pyrophosphatase
MTESTDRFQFAPEQQEHADEVLRLAQTCQYDENHTRQVVKLALQIFNQFESFFRFGKQEQFYLWCAAFLHDIGIQTEGTRGHHKTALHIILSTPLLHFSSKDRLIIGSIARYHRKTLPNNGHSHYAALNEDEKKMVSNLAAILRVADGLDYGHKNIIDQVSLSIQKDRIILNCRSKQKNGNEELRSAAQKSDLLAECTARRILFAKNE